MRSARPIGRSPRFFETVGRGQKTRHGVVEVRRLVQPELGRDRSLAARRLRPIGPVQLVGGAQQEVAVVEVTMVIEEAVLVVAEIELSVEDEAEVRQVRTLPVGAHVEEITVEVDDLVRPQERDHAQRTSSTIHATSSGRPAIQSTAP